jgi:hypothetical protein
MKGPKAMETKYKGIDYGLGRTNIDNNGIRFGVINQSEVGQAWYDESETEYGEPTCPKCGSAVVDIEQVDDSENELQGIPSVEQWEEYKGFDIVEYACEQCELLLGSDNTYPESPLYFYYIDNEYRIFQSQGDTDLFIEKSPYFTFAQFCSPCAPGAVYLINPIDEKDNNNKGYCLGHDWFEDGQAPYPVYSIETGKLVKPKG